MALSFLGSSLIVNGTTHAAISDNSRLAYGNAGAFCNGSTGVIGMVWLSNQPDYYSETVTVGETDTAVGVSVRGAANVCIGAYSSYKIPAHVYAEGVSSMNGNLWVSGNRFYRGTFNGGGSYEWTTPGDRLSASLNVSGVAPCSASGGSGVSTGMVEVGIRRYLGVYMANGEMYGNGWGDEYINVNVRRTCPTSNFQLDPAISVSPAVGEANTPITVSPGINNSGATPSTSAQWWIRRVTVSPTGSISGATTNGQSAASYFGGTQIANGTNVFARGPTSLAASVAGETLGDLPVGTRVCYTLSVAPFRHDNSGIRHGTPACVTVSKRLKVQVTGGDLIVGRNSVSNTAPVGGSRVVTGSPSFSGGNYYGSWAEYGIVPSGTILGMASGSGYAGGNPNGDSLCKVSALSFVNRTGTTCSPSLVGRYALSTTAPDVAARFRTNSTTPALPSTTVDITGQSLAGLYRTTASSVSIRSSGQIPAGRSLIINAPNTDVTISSNIAYASGSLSAVDRIPQVVIIARSISIANTTFNGQPLTNVDAWLIAVGSGNAGYISTCASVAPGSPTNATLNANTCNNKLTVNGPIVANKLYLYRTAGAGTGSNSGDPAEVFNLRADAYIWGTAYSAGTGRIPTVSTKELPPRF